MNKIIFRILLEIINTHKSIIVLDGALPDKELLEKIDKKVALIAADGAAYQLIDLGLTPTYIVGDGDSFKGKIDENKTTLIKESDQDTTDFEKCIAFAKSSKLFPALVLGMSGGELDHILGNCEAFLKHAEDGSLYFLDTYQKAEDKKIGAKLGLALTKGKVSLEMTKGTVLSLFSFDKAVISTKGLQWELKDFALTNEGILALRNVVKNDVVEFDVKKGRVLLVADIDIPNSH